MEECYDCGCYESDLGGCTMPSIDRSYACPIESVKNCSTCRFYWSYGMCEWHRDIRHPDFIPELEKCDKWAKDDRKGMYEH